MTKQEKRLSFELDRNQEPDPILELYETSFPGSRHRFIELTEDSGQAT